VSSYAFLYVDGLQVMSFRNGVPPTFLLLFRKDDLRMRRITGKDRPALGYDDDEEIDVTEFTIHARQLRDRLDVLGLGVRAVETAFSEITSQMSDRSGAWMLETPVPDALAARWAEERAVIAELSFERWARTTRDAAEAGAKVAPRADAVGSLNWLLGLWDDTAEPRLVLRAMVEAFSDSSIVLDITDLVAGGWLEGDVDPRTEALEEFGWILANGAPAVVLTEGSSDARILSDALRVLRPHLIDFITFPDFSVGAEGGAGALVRLFKALWAAGISNRILAVFDNDTAGHEALRTLRDAELPANLRYTTLPTIDLGSAYPTEGPNGTVKMDVNGSAGSIELYLGTDVLTDGSGDLRAVQWTGYSRALGRYQGELIDKASLHERFARKVRDAVRENTSTSGDWSELSTILDHLINILREPASPVVDRVSVA